MFHGTKTDSRFIDLRVRRGAISAIYVYPKRNERFDVNLVFAKADLFTFHSGLLKDSTSAFLVAERENIDIRVVNANF